MSDEIAEIIPRPPSSPIGSTLLITSTIGLILAIGIVWSELFTEYLPGKQPGQSLPPEMSKHEPTKEAESHARDHYKEDFPEDDILTAVEHDLGVGQKVGDLTVGSGDAPPENPDGQ